MTTTDHLVTRTEQSSANRAPAPALFKVGDRVRVLPGEGTFRFKDGAEFTVRAIGGAGHIGLEGVQDEMWLPSRFELIEEPAPEPAEWTPGEGWREAEREEAQRAKVPTLILDGLTRKRYWIQEAPVPSLPTEPWTVIRPHWDTSQGSYADKTLTLGEDGKWGDYWEPKAVARLITGFEVLAEPRADTAAAVIEFVTESLQQRRIRADGLREVLSNARHEFGAAS